MQTANTTYFLLTIILFFIPGGYHLQAQILEWRYEFDYPVKTRCGDFLVDENQHVFANISTHRPDNSYRGGGMFALDARGRFNGMIINNKSTSEATYAPFGKGKYISSQGGGTSVFDGQGNLIAFGEGFGGNHAAHVTTAKGQVYFSKPIDNFKASYITIGRVSKDFKIDYDSVSLKPIAIEGLGLSIPYKKPAQTADGLWIVPINCGRVDGPSMSVDHTFFCAIRDEEILWTFPNSMDEYPANVVTTYGDSIGVVLSGHSKANKFFILDRDGQVRLEFDFEVTGVVEDVKMTAEHVAILTTNSLFIFTMEGVQVSHSILTNEFRIYPTAFEAVGNGHYIIAGNFDGKAAIIRISIPGLNSQPASNSDNLAGTDSPVSHVAMETISPEAISASIFPNPASLYINFELKSDVGVPYTIAVFDASGKQLHKQVFEGHTYTLSLDQFAPGTYFYHLQTASGGDQFLSGKFIKV
jgi:hypothetical protein